MQKNSTVIPQFYRVEIMVMPDTQTAVQCSTLSLQSTNCIHNEMSEVHSLFKKTFTYQGFPLQVNERIFNWQHVY